MQKRYIMEKKYIVPLDDDGAIVHCIMANDVQATE